MLFERAAVTSGALLQPGQQLPFATPTTGNAPATTAPGWITTPATPTTAPINPVPNLGSTHFWSGYNTSLPYGNNGAPGIGSTTQPVDGGIFGSVIGASSVPGLLNPQGGGTTPNALNIPPFRYSFTVPPPGSNGVPAGTYNVSTMPSPTSVADLGYPHEDAPSALSGNLCQVALGDGSVRSVIHGIGYASPIITGSAVGVGNPVSVISTWNIVIDPASTTPLTDNNSW
jgi:hypothetical protein